MGAGAGTGSAAGGADGASATAGEGFAVGAGSCCFAACTVACEDGRAACFGVARFGAEVSPASIADTTTCERVVLGANSSPLAPAAPAAARSRTRASSATADPSLLHAAAPIRAAHAAIRPTRPCVILIMTSLVARLPTSTLFDVRPRQGVNDPDRRDTGDDRVVMLGAQTDAGSCCASTEVDVRSVGTRQKAPWAPTNPTSSAAHSIS
jgi:hypothetical protein